MRKPSIAEPGLIANHTSRSAVIALGLVLLTLFCAGDAALGQHLPSARPADVGLSVAALERIAPALEQHAESIRVPAILAVVARHGKIAYVTSVGAGNSEKPHSVDLDAVYGIYSMTKPIVSAAVMQLYERGKLRLDDPVAKYVPAFAQVTVFAGGSATQPELRDPDRPITITDLLTHTAGLTYGFFGETPVDSIYRQAGLSERLTTAQFVDSLAHLPLLYSPGTRWVYSYAIDVLGRVVEVASGVALDRYLDSAIFKPLNMRSTAFHATPAMMSRTMPVYARGSDGKVVQSSPPLAPRYTAAGKMLSGGGGLLSTPADYLRFAQMLLNGGELDGHRVLKRETVALMLQNHLPSAVAAADLVPLWTKGRYGFGYGGAVRIDSSAADPSSVGTFRWAGAASTFFTIDPKADLIAMVWTQYVPVDWSLDARFQQLVYTAIVK